MKVLLISPNTLTVPFPVYPIGLDYVAGSIALEHEVRIADLHLINLDALARLLREFQPDIIGLSLRNIDNTDAGDPLFFVNEYRDLTAWLRQRTKATLVCGGSGFTIMPQQVLAMVDADYGIIGEGERFGLLVEALATGRNPAAIPGVLTTDGPATVPLPWPKPLARRFRHDADHTRFYLDNGGMLNLQSKRGCVFQCSYCPYPGIEGSTHRLTDPGEVARTALQLERAGARYLFFTDSAFNSDVRHSLAVAEALRTAGITIPWGAFFAPLAPPPGYFAAMAAAGCRHVEFGTESLSATMLKAFRKPFRPEDVSPAHQQARAAGLHTAHYFLLGGPGESEQTITESLDAIEQLDKAVFFFFIGIRIYPGTALYETALAEGKINAHDNMLQPVFYQPDDLAPETMHSLVTRRANGRRNWVTGAGGTQAAAVIHALHRRGFTGPLWEHLAR